LLPWRTSSAAEGGSYHAHYLPPFPTSDQLQGAGYSESKVETDATALQLEISVANLELEMDTTALELEAEAASLELETEVPQETSKQERYSAD
jgi:hypothetical protein